MRPTPPPAPLPLPETCNGNVSNCGSNPPQYITGSRGAFEANVAIVLIMLLCALICAIALNIAIRCSLRHRRRLDEVHNRKLDVEMQQQPNSPTMIYSAGTRLARDEVECAICLAEFVEGDEIKVLSKCKHGFHVSCITRWLSSRASCPTCRASYLPSSLSLADEQSCAANPISATDRPNRLFRSRSYLL